MGECKMAPRKGFRLPNNRLAHRNARAEFSTKERLHRLHDGNWILPASLFRDYEIIFEGLCARRGKSDSAIRVNLGPFEYAHIYLYLQVIDLVFPRVILESQSAMKESVSSSSQIFGGDRVFQHPRHLKEPEGVRETGY